MPAKVVSEIPGLNIEDLKLQGFKVHELPKSTQIPVSRGRRDYFILEELPARGAASLTYLQELPMPIDRVLLVD